MKYIDEEQILNKKVLLRCDYNVPIQNGKVTDNSRIAKSLKTINYLLNNNCSIIILSHLGRVKTRDDKEENTLKPVAEELQRLINREVMFLNSPVGMDVLKTCRELLPGQIVMLENTRYCDIDGKLESSNDANLAKYWSALGDVFVLDAFGSMHRAHASTAGIGKYLPTYYGFLVKDELEHLNPLVMNIQRPFTVFMGGAKVDDKLGYIKKLLTKCDYLLLGGGIANSFLLALRYDIGDSIATNDEEILSEIKTLLKDYKDKIILPVDFVINNNQIFDLNTKSVNKYIPYFEKSKTIFINGTCGKFENPRYATGTLNLFKSLKNISAIKIAGGGDTLNFVNQYKLDELFNYLSSGGGACLEYISNNSLEAIKFLENNSFSTK